MEKYIIGETKICVQIVFKYRIYFSEFKTYLLYYIYIYIFSKTVKRIISETKICVLIVFKYDIYFSEFKLYIYIQTEEECSKLAIQKKLVI